MSWLLYPNLSEHNVITKTKLSQSSHTNVAANVYNLVAPKQINVVLCALAKQPISGSVCLPFFFICLLNELITLS